MTHSQKPSSDPAGAESQVAQDRRSGDELRRRLGQQAAVADVGRMAMEGLASAALADRAVRAISDQLGIPFAAVAAPRRGGGLTVIARLGLEEHTPDPSQVQSGEDGQSRFTLEQRVVVVSPDLVNEERFSPNPILVAGGARSSVSVPVGVQGQPYGVLIVASRRLDDFSAEDVHFVESMANTIGAAIDRERAQEEIEAEHDRLEEALASTQRSERRFRELADSAPVFIWTASADGLVDFINRGWLEYTGNTLEEELGDTWGLGVHPEDEAGVTESWRRALHRKIAWEREYRLRRHDGQYRWIVDRGVPLFDGERLTGYVGTATDIHERKRAEQQLSHAYQRDHEVAEVLQRSMLPERIPQIQGVHVEARYLPASEGQMIGGDWYDALELDDGRVVVAVGDVVGHGLRAASIMGQLRNAFRAYAVLGESPATTLSRLNRLLLKDGRDLMATAFSIMLDRDTGHVTYASAGHPPPLVVGVDGSGVFLEGGRAVPLGTSDSTRYTEAEAEVRDGSTLLLYTDGLIERRDIPFDQRLDDLARLSGEAGAAPLSELCDRVLNGALEGRKPADDVALIAIRADPVTEGALTLRLKADPSSLVQLRRRLGRFLQNAEANPTEEFDIVLAVSEAAMNAIEHAYGPGDAEFTVDAEMHGPEFMATVRDRGSWREQRSGGDRGRGVSIMHALMETVEIARTANGTTVRLGRRIGEDAAVGA